MRIRMMNGDRGERELGIVISVNDESDGASTFFMGQDCKYGERWREKKDV